MPSLTQKASEWVSSVVPGSTAKVNSGYAATSASPNRCNPGWFPSQSTIIFGLEARPLPNDPPNPTAAEWRVPLPTTRQKPQNGACLIIACVRSQGGLHSETFGPRARVVLNGRTIDDIGLKDAHVPGHHDNFFPSSSNPVFTNGDLDACGTVYRWRLDPELLKFSNHEQIVAVHIDPGISWDIDFVGIAFLVDRRCLCPWVQNVIYSILGAVVGALLAHFL
jgi:hypothetical protein